MAVSFIRKQTPFPSAESADDAIGGLLAVGGDLSPDQLLAAYRAGAFPWFEDDQAPIHGVLHQDFHGRRRTG